MYRRLKWCRQGGGFMTSRYVGFLTSIDGGRSVNFLITSFSCSSIRTFLTTTLVVDRNFDISHRGWYPHFCGVIILDFIRLTQVDCLTMVSNNSTSKCMLPTVDTSLWFLCLSYCLWMQVCFFVCCRGFWTMVRSAIYYSALHIRLALYGCANRPYYQIVVMQRSLDRNDPPLEQIGENNIITMPCWSVITDLLLDWQRNT